jgi:hypothetical protein
MPRLERRGILDLSGHDRAKKPALAEPPATDQDLNPGDRVEGLGNFGKPTGEFGTEPGKQERVEKLNSGDLDPMERERFSKQWESVQSRFVDSPRGAAAEADDLVSPLMKPRGYPVSDFDQRRPTFRSTIPESWTTTGLRMRLRWGLGKTKQARKICEQQ